MTGKPLVSTLRTLIFTFARLNRVATEADVVEAGPWVDAGRPGELPWLSVGSVIVVRLPPTVRGSLDHHGYIAALIAVATTRAPPITSATAPAAGPPDTLDAARLLPIGP